LLNVPIESNWQVADLFGSPVFAHRRLLSGRRCSIEYKAMNLDKRQKLLLGIFAGVLLLWQGSGIVWGIFFGPFDSRNTQIAALDLKLKEKRQAKFDLDLTERHTRIWERRSLPPDPVVASTMYHHWILDLANSHKLERLTVNPKRVSTGLANPVFTRIPISVTAECKMDQLCRFLYDFYRTDLMHKVTHLGIESQDFKPNPTLKVSLELEALSLASAKPRKSLFADKQDKAVSEALAKKSADDYKILIDQNRFVRGYNGPPKPADPPAPPAAPFDSAPYTRLVGVTEIDGQPPEAWLYDATSNQRTVLLVGKEFEIAGVKGQVLEIHNRDSDRYVKLRVKDKNWRLDIGDNLKQMVELKPDAAPPASNEKPTSPAAPNTAAPPAQATPPTSAKAST
jgi:hypothetical protein